MLHKQAMYMSRAAAFLVMTVWTVPRILGEMGDPHTMISRIVTNCELEAISIGSILADHFNSFDEATEWDKRLHNDFLTEHLGLSPWMVQGTWKSGGKTANNNNAQILHKRGGWVGSTNYSHSSYWALENKWLYMMGDSTTRQVWATFVSPFQSNNFERNAKEYTREHCARQYPRRRAHPADHYFPEEGWGGRCGNNEVTCHLSGYGKQGIISFDWKHFTYEDYDEWLFGPTGLWGTNDTAARRPDVLTFQIGLHTCTHAYNDKMRSLNESMIQQHIAALPTLMKAVRTAVDRTNDRGTRTTVILITAGRNGNPDPQVSHCSWRFNRLAAREAHVQGFAVLEREEIERRILFKSEFNLKEYSSMKFILHLHEPAPQIVGTALIGLISCLAKNGTDVGRVNNPYATQANSFQPFKAFKRPHKHTGAT